MTRRKRLTATAALDEYRAILAQRLLDYCEEQSKSQRDLAAQLGRHFSTVNGYLAHPGTINIEFVRLVSERVPGMSGEAVEFRRLEDLAHLPAPNRQHELRKQEIIGELREQIGLLKDGLDSVVDLVEAITRSENSKKGAN